jgi:hypothetical protein
MATDGLWFAGLVTSVSLLTAAKRSALLLEFIHAHRWKGRRGMMMCLVVMNLMNRYGRVNNVWLNSVYIRVSKMSGRRFRRQKFTFLDYWLDRLVHVMVHVLALDSGIMASSLLAFHARLGIVILLVLVIEAIVDLVGIVVLERAMLNRCSFVMVLLGQDF